MRGYGFDRVGHGKRLAQGVAWRELRRPVMGVRALFLTDQPRVRQDERLALPPEPEFTVKAWLVEIGVKLRDHARRIPERGEEHHLRRAAARRADIGEYFQQGHVVGLVGGLVGDVEDDEVHACVRQHLRVAAQDIGIVGEIIAELRLAPVMHRAHGSPKLAGGFAHGVGVALEDLGDIVRAADDVRAVPEEVEDADIAIWTRRPGLGCVGQGAAQGVGGGPGVAHRVPGGQGRGSVGRLSVKRAGELATEGEQ